MSPKKRKPLGSAMEEFVFGTNNEAASLEFRLSRSKSASAVRLANSSQERQWSLATSYQTQP